MKIIAISSVVPNNIVLNENKNTNSTGIKQRFLSKNHSAADLAELAALRLLDSLNKKREEVDCLMVVTQTPILKAPPDSLILHGRLGLRQNIPVLDSGLGCSAYTHSLYIINSLLKSNAIKNCLLLVSDCVASKYIDTNDSATNQIFSDCGTATWLEPSFNEVRFDINADGTKYDAITIAQNMFMDGIKVFKFATTAIPKSLAKVATPKEIDYLVLHQAQKMILDQIVKKYDIPFEKVLYSYQEYGNTSTGTIPITLCHTHPNKYISGNIAMCGFGIGLSWCSAFFPQQNIFCERIHLI